MMRYDPTRKDWAVADALWELLEAMPREKARTIITSLITCSPTAIEAAKNILSDETRAV